MQRSTKPVARAAIALASIVVMMVSVFPLLVAVSSSLKTGDGLFDPSLWPAAPTLENYRHLFAEHPFGRNLLEGFQCPAIR